VEASSVVSFAQISDLHLSTLNGTAKRALFNKRLLGYFSWYKNRRHEHSDAVLEALIRDFTAADPDQLLICGDLTHVGLPDEFRQVREWLDTLAIRAISVVPGNHDSYVTEPWLTTYEQWKPYLTSVNRELPSSSEDAFPSLNVRGNVAFIGLNSAIPSLPFFATGRLGVNQLQRLDALLEETARKGLFRVVYLHHPPFPGMEKRRKQLRDCHQLADHIYHRGAELILYGHTHHWQIREHISGERTIPLIGVASASARGIRGEVASYNYFRVAKNKQGWHLAVENRRYNAEQSCFSVAEQFNLNIMR